MNPTLATILGVVGAIISVISITFVVITFALNRKKDNREEQEKSNKEMNDISRSLLGMELTLKQINTTTDETRTDIKAMNVQLIEHGKQIAIIQRDLSTAFKNIDELKETKADK